MLDNKDPSKHNNNNENINQESDYKLIDEIDQKLIELLLRGYPNKKIALDKSPLSTIQRRIRKIFENQYIHKKTELNHKRLGLREGYLLISLKGDHSNLVAQNVSKIRGITCVSLVTGSIDILCACLFRETSDLFKIIETIKTIENVDNVSWAEEVNNIASKEITLFNFQGSINSSIEDNNTNDSNHKETAS